MRMKRPQQGASVTGKILATAAPPSFNLHHVSEGYCKVA